MGTLVSYIAGLGCVAIAACAQPPQIVVLPPVTLAATEAAQINVMSSAANYPGWSFVTTCNVSVTFYAADGTALDAPASFVVGQAAEILSVQLPYAATGAKSAITSVSARIALAANGSVFSVLSPPIPSCAVAFSLQTYDAATGVTHAYVSGEAAGGTKGVAAIGAVTILPCLNDADSCDRMYGFESTPTQVIVLPPLGLATTETAEVDLISSAAGFTGSGAASCHGSIAFYDADGAAIGPATNFVLGESAPQVISAQLPYAWSGAARGRRPARAHTLTGAAASTALVSAQIALTHPGAVFYPASAVPPCPAAFSLKTFGTATGVTHNLTTGQPVQ